MTANRDMDALAFVATGTDSRPGWGAFSKFCELRGRGRRVEAFKQLDLFLSVAVSWPSGTKLEFVKYILEKSDDFADRTVLLPQPLRERLLVPVLREWTASTPNDASPHLWLGLLGCDIPAVHLERALELDSSCEIARKTLTQWILGDVEYNQHELPAFYIHDPRHDLVALDRAQHLASATTSETWRPTIDQEIMELRERAMSWLAAHPGENDFAIR